MVTLRFNFFFFANMQRKSKLQGRIRCIWLTLIWFTALLHHCCHYLTWVLLITNTVSTEVLLLWTIKLNDWRLLCCSEISWAVTHFLPPPFPPLKWLMEGNQTRLDRRKQLSLISAKDDTPHIWLLFFWWQPHFLSSILMHQLRHSEEGMD